MTGARGLLAGGSVLAGMFLVGSACAQQAPQASSVQGVYDCAVKLLEAERWNLAESRTGRPAPNQDPQYLIAVLERNATYLNLDVRSGEKGAIVAKVSTSQAGGLAEEAGRLQQRIVRSCIRQ